MTKLMTKETIIYRRNEAMGIHYLHTVTHRWWRNVLVNKLSYKENQKLIKNLAITIYRHISTSFITHNSESIYIVKSFIKIHITPSVELRPELVPQDSAGYTSQQA